MRDNSAEEVGRLDIATVYICHSWNSYFLETLNSLQFHFKDAANTFLWIDFCSINQHAGSGYMDTKWFQSIIPRAVTEIGHTVFLFSPWQVLKKKITNIFNFFFFFFIYSIF